MGKSVYGVSASKEFFSQRSSLNDSSIFHDSSMIHVIQFTYSNDPIAKNIFWEKYREDTWSQNYFPV